MQFPQNDGSQHLQAALNVFGTLGRNRRQKQQFEQFKAFSSQSQNTAHNNAIKMLAAQHAVNSMSSEQSHSQRQELFGQHQQAFAPGSGYKFSHGDMNVQGTWGGEQPQPAEQPKPANEAPSQTKSSKPVFVGGIIPANPGAAPLPTRRNQQTNKFEANPANLAWKGRAAHFNQAIESNKGLAHASTEGFSTLRIPGKQPTQPAPAARKTSRAKGPRGALPPKAPRGK
jgi:hypothetical protein